MHFEKYSCVFSSKTTARQLLNTSEGAWGWPSNKKGWGKERTQQTRFGWIRDHMARYREVHGVWPIRPGWVFKHSCVDI